MTTKFGIFSDLHLDFAPYDFQIEPDVYYLNAGDTHSNFIERGYYLDKFIYAKTCSGGEKNIYSVLGNHDYYNFLEFPEPQAGMVFKDVVNGLTIIGATLWTDLSNYIQWGDYIHNLVDYKYIRGMTYEKYNLAHIMQKKWVLDSGADIIVTHHAPSYMSLHPRYKGMIANSAFMTELSEDILNMKKPPKLWVHGHVHDSFDYMIGETRVICHPRGYPDEINFNNYQPKVIEL